MHRNISTLAKDDLIAKVKNAKYDGYRLTYGGLDYLAMTSTVSATRLVLARSLISTSALHKQTVSWSSSSTDWVAYPSVPSRRTVTTFVVATQEVGCTSALLQHRRSMLS